MLSELVLILPLSCICPFWKIFSLPLFCDCTVLFPIFACRHTFPRTRLLGRILLLKSVFLFELPHLALKSGLCIAMNLSASSGLCIALPDWICCLVSFPHNLLIVLMIQTMNNMLIFITNFVYFLTFSLLLSTFSLPHAFYAFSRYIYSNRNLTS